MAKDKTLEEILKAASVEKDFQGERELTTHNPAVLDGLNLNDDNQQLFVVSRKGDGQTRVERLRLKLDAGEKQFMLSELWQRRFIGGLPDNF